MEIKPVTREADLLEVLQDLCQQIEVNDFKDGIGHPAKMLQAYRDARRLLERIEAESAYDRQDVCSYPCKACGMLSVFPGFSEMRAFELYALWQAANIGRDGSVIPMPLRPVLPPREQRISRNLASTLQALYDSEINVTITTLWDAGYDVCSSMEWPKKGENFTDAWEHVKTADKIADKLHEMAMAKYPTSTYARKQPKICRVPS